MSRGSTPHVCINLGRDECHMSSDKLSYYSERMSSSEAEKEGWKNRRYLHILRVTSPHFGLGLCLKYTQCWCEMVVNRKNREYAPSPPGNGWKDAHRAENWYFNPPHSKTFSNRVPTKGFIETFLSDLPFILNCKDSWSRTLCWFEYAHVTVILEKKANK